MCVPCCLIHSLVDGHLRCLQFYLAFMNGPVVNMAEWFYFVSFSLVQMYRTSCKQCQRSWRRRSRRKRSSYLPSVVNGLEKQPAQWSKCTSKGHGFNSQHPLGASQVSVTFTQTYMLVKHGCTLIEINNSEKPK